MRHDRDDGGTEPADNRTKRLTLLACVLASTIVMIDGSVVGVALPAIRDDLGGGLAGQQWVTNGYLLALGSLLLVAGSLGDVLGARRVFLAGVVGFGVTSVLCALAPTIEVLVVGRALQGASGAALTPAALAVIVSVFDTDERNRAIGTWTAWSGIGAAVGPVLGGWLVDVASWHWVFLINVPLVLVTVALVARVVPGGHAPGPERRIDLPGALLCATGLGAITFGLIQQPLAGWGAPDVLAPLAGGVTHRNLLDVEDQAAKHGFGATGEARFATGDLDLAQTGVSLHRLRPGARQAFGHAHGEAEEVYVVLAGSGRARAGDDELPLRPHDAIRVGPETVRAFEADDEGLELLAVGPRRPGDGRIVPGWWG